MKPTYTITKEGFDLVIEVRKPNYTLNQYQTQTIKIPLSAALDTMLALNQYFNDQLQTVSNGEHYENQ